MASTLTAKKLLKLVKAVRRNPDSNRAWGALSLAAPKLAESMRDMLVAQGEMQLAE